MIKVYPSDTDPSNPPSPTAICIDATNATVQHDLDPTSEYSLTFDCPQDFEISHRMMVSCEVEDGTTQFFRVSRITRPLTGMKTVYADHVSRDLNSLQMVKAVSCGFKDTYPLTSILGQHVNDAQNAYDWPYRFVVDTSRSTTMEADGRLLNFKTFGSSVMDFISGDSASICDLLGVDVLFDNTSIVIVEPDFDDVAATVLTGARLVELEAESDGSDFFNAIAPYANVDGKNYELKFPGYLALGDADGRIVAKRIDLSDYEPVKVTDYFSFCKAARHYRDAHSTNGDALSIELDAVGIEALGDRPSVGDVVEVIAPNIEGSVRAQVSEVTYDPLLKRVTGVTVGEPKNYLVGLSKPTNKRYTAATPAEKAFRFTSISSCILSNGDCPSFFEGYFSLSEKYSSLIKSKNYGTYYLHIEWEGTTTQAYSISIKTNNSCVNFVWQERKGGTLPDSSRIVILDDDVIGSSATRTCSIAANDSSGSADFVFGVIGMTTSGSSIYTPCVTATITGASDGSQVATNAYSCVFPLDSDDPYKIMFLGLCGYSVKVGDPVERSVTAQPTVNWIYNGTMDSTCNVGDLVYVGIVSNFTFSLSDTELYPFTSSNDGCVKLVSDGDTYISSESMGFGEESGWMRQMFCYECVNAGTVTFKARSKGQKNTPYTITVTVTE